jgi:membrane fusion protein, multidrug efflux system
MTNEPDISENTQSQSEPQPATPGNRRWLWIGGAVGVLLLGWWGVTAAGGEDVWPTAETQAELAEAEAAPPASAPPRRPAPTLETPVRGIVKARREATVASRMTAIITQMPYGEGESFRAGALLARFDCSQTQAELNAARAAAAAYRSTYQQNAELDEYEAIGRNEVEVSRANLGRAEAEAQAIAARLSDCAVYAPFAGTVVERIANAREVAASGQPLMRIQSGRDVELELIIPSRWLTWVGPGATFAFRIDETGNTVRGQVSRLGASVDPVSRTIRVTARVTETNGLILPGMSGTATFDDPRATSDTATVAPGAAGGAAARSAVADDPAQTAAPAARP